MNDQCPTCKGRGELGDIDKDVLPTRCTDCAGTGEVLEECLGCHQLYPSNEMGDHNLCWDCEDNTAREQRIARWEAFE